MSKEAKQSSNWDFKVQQVKLMTEGGQFSGFYGNQRMDNLEVLGVVTEQYGIVQNSELMDVATAALDRLGMKDAEQRVIVAGNGERTYVEFTFKNKQMANSVGDVFGYKLTLQNSFDRTLRAAIALGLIRLTCLNGQTTLEKEFSANARHSTKISVDFVSKAITAAMTKGPEALRVFDRLAEIGISDEQGQNVLSQFEHRKILSGKLRESIETLWLNPRRQEDRARTLYNLYNAATEHLSHQVAGERYEYAQKTSANVLFSLVNASRKPEQLARLIIPAPRTDGTVIVVDSSKVIDVEVVA